MSHNSFTQKVLLAIFAGFIAACLFWLLRHVVEQAFFESGAGWKTMFEKNAQRRR